MTEPLTKEDISLLREITEGLIQTLDDDRTMTSYPEEMLRVLDEVERLRSEVSEWQRYADIAAGRMTGRTWDEPCRPGALASIANGAARNRKEVERLRGTIETLEGELKEERKASFKLRVENDGYCGYCAGRLSGEGVCIRSMHAPNPFCCMTCAKQWEGDND